MQSRTYEPCPLSCFAITDPKLREVWASDFRDRVVHHLLVSYLEPIFERKFIFHSYACRQNKGAHKAVEYLRKAFANCHCGEAAAGEAIPGHFAQTAGWLRPETLCDCNQFYLQADIRSYFVSIDKQILYSIIGKRVRDPDILWLAEKIIFQIPVNNCRIKGERGLLAAIPPHKSLFHARPGKGLPIGNLTSQFFANVYLNELDQFVKHQLKCRRYFRYMDDFILLSPYVWELKLWRDEIALFLNERLCLELHPEKRIIQPVARGINFCGYIIKPDYALVRRRTVRKLKQKLWRFNQKVHAHAIAKSGGEAIPYNDASNPGLLRFARNDNKSTAACNKIFNDPFLLLDSPELSADLQKIYASVNSTYGSFKHADCYGLRQSLYEKHFGVLKLYLRPADRNYSYFAWIIE